MTRRHDRTDCSVFRGKGGRRPVLNKTFYTTDTFQRGGSGDIGVAPVHVHPIIARRAKQVVPKSQIPIDRV